jgi:histone H3/H4
MEKELSDLFKRLKKLAKHARRKTVKIEDFKLYLQEKKK